MSYFEESVEVVSLVGKVEITSTNSSRFVTLDTDGEFALAGANVAAFGVITTNQPAGVAGRVVFAGTVPVEAGEAIDIGDPIATGANGVAMVATSGQIVQGVARTAASAGEVTAVHLNRPVGATVA